MNILFSYFYMNRPMVEFVERCGHQGVEVMMDSGAFTVHMKGATIRLGEYMAACRKLEPHLLGYVTLDVLFDRAATRRNLERFLEKGLRPMAVWTIDGDPSDLEHMKASGLHQVCIAGGAIEKIDWYGPRTNVARSVLGPDVFVHSLGFTGKHVTTLPIDSVDSSSYKEAGRFGTMALYTPEAGMRRINISELRRKGFGALPQWTKDLLVRAGVQESVGEQHQKGLYSTLYLLGLSTWVDYAKDLRRHGIRLFFAVANERELCPLALVLMHKGENGFIDWKTLREHQPLVHRGVVHDYEGFAAYFTEAANRHGLTW